MITPLLTPLGNFPSSIVTLIILPNSYLSVRRKNKTPTPFHQGQQISFWPWIDYYLKFLYNDYHCQFKIHGVNKLIGIMLKTLACNFICSSISN
jgi:hypothetical protein